MAENTQSNPNQPFDRRREERALEHLTQDSVERMTDLATSSIEVWQKQLAFGGQVARYWSDTFNIAQQSLEQMASTVKQRRAA